MIPSAVYAIACALEGVESDPCDDAIHDAWRVYNAMTAKGWSFQIKDS